MPDPNQTSGADLSEQEIEMVIRGLEHQPSKPSKLFS